MLPRPDYKTPALPSPNNHPYLEVLPPEEGVSYEGDIEESTTVDQSTDPMVSDSSTSSASSVREVLV